MNIILLLHILLEGLVGLCFLFYPAAGDIIPGFAEGEGPSYDLLMKMYGLAAIFLAAIGVVAFRLRSSKIAMTYKIMLWLAAFHFGMAGVQLMYNADQRAGLLHLLLGLFMMGIYIRRPGSKFNDVRK